MDELDIDYEGTATQGQSSSGATTSANDEKDQDVTSLNGSDKDDVTGKDGSSNDENPEVENESGSEQTTSKDSDNPSTGVLSVGDNLEIDGKVYTVAQNGDLVDDKGVVFKEAKDVNEWLKSVDIEDPNSQSSIDINSIQEAVGVTITDENGEEVEFTNDANGVKSYIDSVIDTRSKELQEAAINRLYADNPILKQFQDYVQLTGTPRGFGEIPDRSGITVERDNEAQQIAIIRMAANEFGNKSLNDNYIKYLKDTGSLYDEACSQLSALVDKDENYRKDIARQAQAAREQEAKELEEYWNNVRKAIDKRVVAGYKIPDSFTKEVDGKKVVMTPDDFFNYISRPVKNDEQGRTGYQIDLANLSDEDYLNREILDAWLMLTGGSYKDLINMAVKEDKVRQLKVKAKEQRTAKAVKIIKKQPTKTSIDDIIL